jgi:hypothetical protein
MTTLSDKARELIEAREKAIHYESVAIEALAEVQK